MSAARILVVDDNPTNLKLVSDVLDCEGYEILKAVDAEEAERIIERHLPELVLIDIALPGMDGLALTRKLKAENKTKDLVIVALTAFAMRGDEEKARDAGCDGYITKPINTRALPALVAGYLKRLKPKATKLSLKILAIEDTPFGLKFAEIVLSSTGHQVGGAQVAAQTLQAVKQIRPQIILLDLLLPNTDGLALARRLKADPETRNIHIVATTSFPENFSKAEVLAAGCDAYLGKATQHSEATETPCRQLPAQYARNDP